MPEGAGNVLDNCAIFGTTEVAEGRSHSNRDMPIVIAGKAGGALKSGIHHRAVGDNASKANLTVLRALGVNDEPCPTSSVRALPPFAAMRGSSNVSNHFADRFNNSVWLVDLNEVASIRDNYRSSDRRS